MIDVLLKKVKELEELIDKLEINSKEAKDKLISILKECKIEKSKKEQVKKELIETLSKIDIKYKDKFFVNKNLSLHAFLELISNEEGYLVFIFPPKDEKKISFLIGYLTKKISPFFTIYKGLIIGFIDENKLKELKKLRHISYFNPIDNEFDEIEVFSVVFDKDKFDFNKIEVARRLAEDFRKRPTFRNKHFIEYSLRENRVIDFEKEKLQKEKKKYEYIFDENYPNLETKLKAKYDDNVFVLTLLEKIDKDIDKIKDSKGLSNIVNRMLNFIESKIDDKTIHEEVNFLRRKLHS